MSLDPPAPEAPDAERARRTRWDRAWPYLVFVAVLLLLFSPAIFGGMVLGGHHDRADQVIPFYVAFSRAFKAHEIPQWNPYIFCGKSMFGSGVVVFFYPVYWIVFALPEALIPRSTTFVLIFHVALALVATFHLFRRLGSDRFWATVAALSYVFSSSATLQMATEVNFTSFTYLPLVLCLIAGQERGRLLRNALAQTVAYALLLLSSNVQLVIYTVGISLAYSLYRAVVRDEPPAPDDPAAPLRPRWWQLDVRRLIACAVAFVLACGIAAARWVPFVIASRAEGSVPVSYAEFLATTPTTWSDFVRFLMPEFFGTDAYEDFYGHINHFESIGAYVGVVGGAIAVYALFLRWNRRTAFWSGWLVFTILLVLGTPLTWLHYVATGRQMLHFTRFAWLASLPCAALIALEGRAFFATVRKRTWIFLAAFGLVSLTAAVVAYNYRLSFGQRVIIGDQSKTAIGLFALLFVVLVILAWVAQRFGETSRIFRGALLATTLLDLTIVFLDEANISLPFFEPMSAFAFPDADVAIAHDLSTPERSLRIAREPTRRNPKIYSQYTVNDRWITLGAYSSSGYDNGSPARILDLYLSPFATHTISRIFQRVIFLPNGRMAEITSTAAVLHEKGPPDIFPKAVRRATLFSRYRKVDDPAALRTLLDPSFDLQSELLLDQAPSFASAPADAETRSGKVDIVEDDFNQVSLSVVTDRPSVLLLNDTFHDAWKVTIDGAAAHPLRANFAFRAVEVPAGEHLVRWTFHQKGLDAGIDTSLAALCALLVAALASAGLAFRDRQRARAGAA